MKNPEGQESGEGESAFQSSFAKLAGVMGRLLGQRPPSKRELRIDPLAFIVKRKLGAGWHSKRISSRARRKRLAELSDPERLVARERGWWRV